MPKRTKKRARVGSLQRETADEKEGGLSKLMRNVEEGALTGVRWGTTVAVLLPVAIGIAGVASWYYGTRVAFPQDVFAPDRARRDGQRR
jgi:hypothetical protein